MSLIKTAPGLSFFIFIIRASAATPMATIKKTIGKNILDKKQSMQCLIQNGYSVMIEQLINDIINYLLPKNDLFLYIFLFVSSIVENLFPPIPGDTITVFGAFMVGTGRLSYFLVFIATTIGSVIGFMVLVVLGRILEREFFMKKNFRFFSAKSIVSAETWFSRYGYIVVLANRFLPGIRSVISLVSGITRLNLLKVFLLSLVSASLWNLLWIEIGFLLGNKWHVVREKAGELIQRYNIGAGIIIGILVILFFIYKLLKKRQVKKEDNDS